METQTQVWIEMSKNSKPTLALIAAFMMASEGAATLEYGLIAGGMSLAGIAAAVGMGSRISAKLDAIEDAMDDMPGYHTSRRPDDDGNHPIKHKVPPGHPGKH